MFGISYDTWKQVCQMYFSLSKGSQKAYLQLFPFSILSEKDKEELSSEDFYNKYIGTGGFVLFPEVMRHSDNYIQKTDGSFRNSSLISPLLFLVIQSVGREIALRYFPSRPDCIYVYYAGNYNHSRPLYKKDYDEFYKTINTLAENYPYFIKTDITNFYGNININSLISQIDTICNDFGQTIQQTQLLLTKELLQYCGNGNYPLIENSIASSYLATVVYLDAVDCELYEYLENKVRDITAFQMVRYVDDLYILFSSPQKIEQLIPAYNAIRNEYSSILKKHGLALNTSKCTLKEVSEINEELKKSLYDEYVNGVDYDIGDAFAGKLEGFLLDIYDSICLHALTNEKYLCLIEQHFSVDDIEFTAEEAYNYLVYENQTELKTAKVSDILAKAINQDVSFLAVDPRRLSAMIMQSGNDNTIKALLNQLFIRFRKGLWNSYDTTIAITYLIQSQFRHIDLLDKIRQKNPDLYSFYNYGCKNPFTNQVKDEKWNRYLRCIDGDKKATFLYFMSICESNRSNYLGTYAYYKNFFDRISADMAFIVGLEPKSKKPKYEKYYRESNLKKLYQDVANSNAILGNAHKLRNTNPLSHASAELIDSESSSTDLHKIQKQLEGLVERYSALKNI